MLNLKLGASCTLLLVIIGHLELKTGLSKRGSLHHHQRWIFSESDGLSPRTRRLGRFRRYHSHLCAYYILGTKMLHSSRAAGLISLYSWTEYVVRRLIVLKKYCMVVEMAHDSYLLLPVKLLMPLVTSCTVCSLKWAWKPRNSSTLS